MQKLYQQHKRKINYLLVGVWNTVFGYLAFVALYFLLSRYVHYLVLVVLTNVFSITNAYIGYKIFVFRTKGNYWQEYLRFYVVYGLSIGVNLVLLPIMVEILRIPVLVAQALIVFVTVIFSYVGHSRFSFK